MKKQRERFGWDFYAFVSALIFFTFTYIFETFKISFETCKSTAGSDNRIYECLSDFNNESIVLFLQALGFFLFIFFIIELFVIQENREKICDVICKIFYGNDDNKNN